MAQVSSWTIEVPFEKLERIIAQIRTIQRSTRLTLRDLQSLVGRLLWLTSAWRHLRPLLLPLYKALRRSLSVTFQTLTAQLDDHLQLRTQLTHKHQSLVVFGWASRIPPPQTANWMTKQLKHWKSGYNCWSLRHFHCRCALQIGYKSTLQLTQWHHNLWQDWGEQPSFLMVLPLGSSFAYHWLKRNRYGHGWVTTCKNTLQHGNCLHSSRYHSALTPTCLAPVARLHVIKPPTIVRPMLLLPKASQWWLRPWQRCWLRISSLCDDIKSIPTSLTSLADLTCWQTNWVASKKHSPLHWTQLHRGLSRGWSCCILSALRLPRLVESGLPNLTFICEKKVGYSPLTGCFHRLVFGEFSLRLVDGLYVWCC